VTIHQPIETPPNSGQRLAERPGHVETAGLSDVGRTRSRNEDAYLIATLQRSMVVHDASPPAAHGWVPGETAGTLLVIADGMGGQGSGDVASQVAVNTTVGYLLNVMPWAAARSNMVVGRDSAPSLWSVREQLSTALVTGDSTVKAVGAQAGSPRMGTTLTMALIQFPMLYVAHVGDTRGYLWRGRELSRLTTDHTLAQQIAERDPDFLEKDSALHNMLWNSLGGSEEVARPQLTKVPLMQGDFILLCSDGLTKHVSDEEISQVLATPGPLGARCTELVARANGAGGSDNITVLLASIS
jgi:serine/threonine protein phosphatase PrpC